MYLPLINSSIICTLQGCYVRNYPIPFSFPARRFGSHWFFHQSVGRFVVCYLPTNVFDDESWVGFSLYVVLKISNLHKIYSGSETPPMLQIDLHSHGSSISHITTFPDLPIHPIDKQVLLFNAPRVYFRQELNQCWGVSTLFRTSIPDVDIEMCGIRVIYEQDLGDFVNVMTECELNSPIGIDPQLRYQEYEELVQQLLDMFESREPKTTKEEMPIRYRYSFERLNIFQLKFYYQYPCIYSSTNLFIMWIIIGSLNLCRQTTFC